MKHTRDGTKIVSLMFAIGRRIREDEHKKQKRRKGKQSAAFSMLHFQTLRYVKEKERPFMRDVAGYLCVTPPAATLLIDGLVKEKLLTRSLDPKDRRTVRVSLALQGKKFLARGIRAKTQKLRMAFTSLTEKERTAFVAILEKVLRLFS